MFVLQLAAESSPIPEARPRQHPSAAKTKRLICRRANSQLNQAQSEGSAMGKGQGVPLFAVGPHFYPPFHGPMPHLNTPMPMMPMAVGIGMAGSYPFHPPPANGAFNQSPVSEGKAKENHSKRTDDEQAATASDSGKGDSKVKISPPELFDHTKPFLYNGQFVYPMPTAFPQPMGPHYLPPGFLGHPGYPVPQYPGPMMGPPPMPMNHMLAPMSFHPPPTALPASGGSANPSIPGRPTTLQPPAAPPISSIRPSEISKKQIESLRTSLKYHEDQLQYNRHQIDEKEMENIIKMLEKEIERFEKLNADQLANEEKNYPKRDKPRESNIPAGLRSSVASRQSNSDEGKIDATSQDFSKGGSQRRRDGFRSRPGINTNISNEASYHFDQNQSRSPSGFNDPVKKSSLPSGAALAPPFEPRRPSGFDPDVVDGIDSGGRSLFSKDVQSEVERKLLAAGASAWGSWGTAPAPLVLNDTTNDDTTIAQSPSYDAENMGRPYLVGILPAGINPQKAKDADYVYERELTEDETRARFLHWGKAPRYARQGLPKYDGKNFYPPSPLKEVPQKESPFSYTSRRVLSGNTLADYSFDTSGGDCGDPFRPVTPENSMAVSKRLATNENAPLVRRPESSMKHFLTIS